VKRLTPGYAKIIMVLQSVAILYFSYWFVEEYLNNIYFQAYVTDLVQANAVLIFGVVIAGALGLSLGLLRVLRSTHKQIGALASQQTVSAPPMSPGARPGLVSSVPTPSGSPSSGSKSAVDLHPMVAALKADLANQASLQPLPPMPPLEVKGPPAPSELPARPAPPPAPAPARPVVGTPSTVITGTMPVLKRVNPKDGNQDSRQ